MTPLATLTMIINTHDRSVASHHRVGAYSELRLGPFEAHRFVRTYFHESLSAPPGLPAPSQLDLVGVMLEFRAQQLKKRVYRMESEAFFTFLQRRCTHIHIRTHTCIHIHIHIHAYAHTRMHAYTQTHISTYTHDKVQRQRRSPPRRVLRGLVQGKAPPPS